MIAINGRFLARKISGVERYATEIVKRMDDLLETPQYQGLKVRIVAPSGTERPDWLRNIAFETCGKRGGYGWEQIDLPRATAGDVLLCLCNLGPLLHRRRILCVHDVNYFIIPQTYSRAFRLVYKTLVPALTRTSARVTTVSNFSRDMLYRYGLVKRSKPIEVIYNGHEHLSGRTSKPIALPDQPYVAMIGSRTYNKNVAIIASIAQRLREAGIAVLSTGKANSAVFDNKTSTQEEDGITYTGYLEDDELTYLLENALCLAFPSFYEGFGIPPLEAMVVGCPAVVSNSSCGEEVCGEAALYADPRDGEAWFRAITSLKDETLRNSLREKGFERCKMFSWEQAAHRYLAMARELGAEG